MWQTILVVGGSCFLFGGLVGWVLGYQNGHAAGVETEKQRLLENRGSRI